VFSNLGLIETVGDVGELSPASDICLAPRMSLNTEERGMFLPF
jgi:hypothetical protein